VSTPEQEGLSEAELEAQTGDQLPERAAMSTLDPGSALDPVGGITDGVGDTVGGVTDGVDVGETVGGATGALGGGLLDLDVNLDLDADAAAPVSAAVAANANVAAPIDAAVSANIASPDGVSIASASQDSVIVQDLDGTAEASVDQASNIEQGEATP
jgi:hypothetical protein